IALEKELNVIDVILQHGEAVDPQSKCPTRVLFGIDAAIAQHQGMNHAATHHFNPAAFFAHPATFAAAKDATDRYLAARFGKGEEAGLEARANLFPKEFLGKEVERPLQVGKRDIARDGQAFDLMEHG